MAVDLHGRAISSIPGAVLNNDDTTSLDLSRNNITSLRKIGQLVSLTSLNVSDNCLDELTADIGRLEALEDLNLHNNSLTELPMELTRLTSLRKLNVSRNRLKSAKGLGKLVSLTDLNLRDNPLGDAPRALHRLNNLTCLSLRNNGIASLVEGEWRLNSLLYLDLSYNSLASLPNELPPNLLCLDVRDNRLSSLPDTVVDLKKLVWLKAGRNRLTALPDEFGGLRSLRHVELDHNLLSMLPTSVRHLTKLQFIDLSDNPISAEVDGPPSAKGRDDICALLKSCLHATATISARRATIVSDDECSDSFDENAWSDTTLPATKTRSIVPASAKKKESALGRLLNSFKGRAKKREAAAEAATLAAAAAESASDEEDFKRIVMTASIRQAKKAQTRERRAHAAEKPPARKDDSLHREDRTEKGKHTQKGDKGERTQKGDKTPREKTVKEKTVKEKTVKALTRKGDRTPRGERRREAEEESGEAKEKETPRKHTRKTQKRKTSQNGRKRHLANPNDTPDYFRSATPLSDKENDKPATPAVATPSPRKRVRRRKAGGSSSGSGSGSKKEDTVRRKEKQKQNAAGAEDGDDEEARAKKEAIRKMSAAIDGCSQVIPIEELTIGKELGSGKFGVVYEGMWRSHCPVAIKLIGDWKGMDAKPYRYSADVRDMFEKEVKMLRRANDASDQVCEMKGVSFHKNGPCIVMRLYRKGHARSVIEAHDGGKPPYEQFLQFAKDLALGVRDMHADGVDIVLRDLKLDNLLVDASDRLYLSDFGVSRVVEDMFIRTRQIGTALYMAPECFVSTKVAKESDIWSMACCMVHLFSGRRPWYHVAKKDLYQKIHEEHPRIPDDMPKRLRRLMERCFSRDPAERPNAQECHEILDAME